jgi:arginyl-tRNA synthetase
MATILNQLRSAFRDAIRTSFNTDADPVLVPASNEKFGDYQCNAAMALAKTLKLKPREVAEKIRDSVLLGDLADKVDIAGPGFINIFLSPKWVESRLNAVAADERLGVATKAAPQTVVVDYSGPNIAKEMHVGHLRSTIIGDAASRVLEFLGDHVIRQNHLGDWGTQFGMLIAHLKSGVGVSTTRGIADLEQFYRDAKKRFDDDPAFQAEARATVVQLQSGNPDVLAAWKSIVESTRAHFQPLYQRLLVLLTEEHERGESFYNPRLRGVVDDLKKIGLAVESDGAIGIFLDGPEKPPLIIEKSGGGFLYGTTDLAAIRYRVNDLRANRIVYFTDSRQAQHFSQVFRAAMQAGWAHGVSLEHAPFGTILGKDNKPFKTRSGDTVKLKDLLDEAEERAYPIVAEKNTELPDEQKREVARAVGIGAVKYSDLSKDRTSDYVFDWDQALALTGNSAPYLQYAHARICAIFRKAGLVASATSPIAVEAPEEIALSKHILRLGEALDGVATDLKPHILCAYLYDLATKFSAFYENCPVLKSDEPTRSSRLTLCALTARTLALGLDLLGIKHPDQM